MKIAFTTAGRDLTAPLDERFGRAPRFLIYDLKTRSHELVDNAPALDAAQGAGVQAAEAVVRAGAQAVVTGHCGPKAYRVLAAAKIAVYACSAATIAAALADYEAGRLAPLGGADVAGHWA